MCAMLNTEQFHDMKYIASFNSVNPELPLLEPPKKLLTPILSPTPTFSDPLIGYPREGVYLINIKIVGFSNEKCDDRHLYGILKPSYIAFFQKCASGASL